VVEGLFISISQRAWAWRRKTNNPLSTYINWDNVDVQIPKKWVIVSYFLYLKQM